MKFRYKETPGFWIHCSDMKPGYVYYSNEYIHWHGELRQDQLKYKLIRPGKYTARLQNLPFLDDPLWDYSTESVNCYNYIHVVRVERI